MIGQGRPPIRDTATAAANRHAAANRRHRAAGCHSCALIAWLVLIPIATALVACVSSSFPAWPPAAAAQEPAERPEASEPRGKSFFGRLGGPLRGPSAQREPTREPTRETSPGPPRDNSRDTPQDDANGTTREATREATRDSARDTTSSPPLELHLRFTWGGGAARAWTGAARLSAGRFGAFRHLGLSGEEPGSIDRGPQTRNTPSTGTQGTGTQGTATQGTGTGGQTLAIHNTVESVFHGCDLEVVGPPTAEVTIELAPVDQPNELRRFTARLDTLVSTPLSHSLDDQRNRVQLARVPGDRLRVDFEREHLVFEPGETFPFTVIANATGQETSASNRIRVWLAPARGSDELMRQEYDLRPRPSAMASESACVVRLPEQEGVYDIHVELLARRTGVGLPLSRARPLMARRVQVVVLSAPDAAAEPSRRDSRTESRYQLPFPLGPSEPSTWRRIAEIDPTNGVPSRPENRSADSPKQGAERRADPTVDELATTTARPPSNDTADRAADRVDGAAGPAEDGQAASDFGGSKTAAVGSTTTATAGPTAGAMPRPTAGPATGPSASLTADPTDGRRADGSKSDGSKSDGSTADGQPAENRSEGRPWTQWLPAVPGWKPTANDGAGMFEQRFATRHSHRGQSLLRLAPNGWTLLPLAVARSGEPHILEIEFANDLPQCLGISVMETDAAGRLLSYGLDTGFEVPPLGPGVPPAFGKHRLVYWPQSRSAWALVVNRHPSAPAYVGRMAVEAGPARLPPASPATSASRSANANSSPKPPLPSSSPTSPVAVQAERRASSRLAAAVFDRPLLAETFQSGRVLESDGSAAWLDWVSFFQGATRLVDYLKFAGYNAAVINVASEGSALYPSALLEPNPRHDSGVFLADGQDPVRKDVLELLFRLFDREGLKLIPAVEFAGPLPELERLSRSGSAEATGLRWIGADGRMLPIAHTTGRPDLTASTIPWRSGKIAPPLETTTETSPLGFLKAGMQAAAAPFSAAFPLSGNAATPGNRSTLDSPSSGGAPVPGNAMYAGNSTPTGPQRDWRITTVPSTATANSLRGKAPRYNLLDPLVRESSLRILDELEQRYGHHPAWGGASLQIGPDSFAGLPGAEGGYDDRTVAAFTADTGIAVPSVPDSPNAASSRFAVRARFLEGEARERWIRWRMSQSEAFYAAARDRIAKRQIDSRLLLNIAGLRHSPALQPFAQPALPVRLSAAEGLRLVGLDPTAWDGQPGIVCPRPFLDAPLLGLAGQGARLEWNRAIEFDRLLAANGAAGGLSYQESLPWQLVSTAAPIATQFLAAGGRQRQSLTRTLRSEDSVLFLQGGRSLALSADPRLRQALATFNSLPPNAFETLSPSLDSQAQAVTVRQMVAEKAVFAYVLNDAPWPVSVEVRFDGPPDLQWELLGQGQGTQRGGAGIGAGTGLSNKSPTGPAAALTRVQGQWLWRLALDPHDLRAIRLDSPQAIVRDWNAVVAPEVPQALQARMNSARARAHNLNSPPPLKTLANAGFEAGVNADSNGTPYMAPARWLSAAGTGITVALEETDPHGGQRALRIRSDRDVVWVRSDPIPAPATGRIAIWGWIRARDKAVQSPLRLAIEGKVSGKTYYRYATVGGGKGPPIPSIWTQYWFQIDDLPMGELSELRIGIDLMGPGDVSVDDLAAYDLWFHDNERDELVKQLGIAGFQLGHGRLLDSHRFLDGYWPRFLEEFVPGETPVVEFTGTGPVMGPATTTPNQNGNSGPASDRAQRSNSGSLRRIGPVRPRTGTDSAGSPGPVPTTLSTPGRAVETAPNATAAKDRQPAPSTRRGAATTVTGTPMPAAPATDASGTTASGTAAPVTAAPVTVAPVTVAPVTVAPPRGERPKAAQAPEAAEKPAAETTWRDRLESLLPKRFW